MRHGEAGVSELVGKVDFGIITIREDEFDAVLQRLPAQNFVTGRQSYAISTVRTQNDDEYLVAMARCVEPGSGQGQLVAQNLIEDFHPQWLLLVGIAGSVPDYEYTLGDVVLATRLHDFCVSASLEDSDGEVRERFSTAGGPMHPDVQNLITMLPALTPFFGDWNTGKRLAVARPPVQLATKQFYGDPQWRSKVKDSLARHFGKKTSRKRPKAFAGSVASSDILVKNTKLADQWLMSSRDIKVIEMELSGVYRAAFNKGTPVLAIRGISDVVGFKRSPDWTKYACHSAASFLAALLRFRPIIPISANAEIVPSKHASPPSTLDGNRAVGVFKKDPYVPPPVRRPERLYSNLLEVSYLPENIHAVSTKCKSNREVWAFLRDRSVDPPADWVYRGKMLFSFRDFCDPIWKGICDQESVTIEERRHWSDSSDQDRISEFIELLKGSLREFSRSRGLDYIHKQKLRGEKRAFRYLYYRATSSFSESPSFDSEDFIDLAGLVQRLTNKEGDLASNYIFAQLPSGVQKLLRKAPAKAGKAILSALVAGLNGLLKTQIYDSDVFEEVYLRVQTLRALDKHLEGKGDLRYLNRLLLEDVYREEIEKRIFADRSVIKKSIVQARERAVFKAYLSSGSGRLLWYRHQAFRYQFLRLEGNWYLEITPTYHYTWDGYRVHSYYEKLVKEIKKLETNEAVFRQVLFWSKVLAPETSMFGEEEPYPYLKFGTLLEVSLEFGLIDELWAKGEATADPVKGRSKRGSLLRRKVDESSSPTDSLFG